MYENGGSRNMSQEKVAKYKEQKANRKEIMKKEKQQKQIRIVVTSLIGAAVIGWIGYSAVNTIIDNQPRQSVEVDYTTVDEYLNGINE